MTVFSLQGKTAIKYAFEDNNLEIVKALLALGADASTNEHVSSSLESVIVSVHLAHYIDKYATLKGIAA